MITITKQSHKTFNLIYKQQNVSLLYTEIIDPSHCFTLNSKKLLFSFIVFVGEHVSLQINCTDKYESAYLAVSVQTLTVASFLSRTTGD